METGNVASDVPVVDVTAEQLVDLVKSRSFRKNLAEAARHTMTAACESGFSVYRDLSSRSDTVLSVVQSDTCQEIELGLSSDPPCRIAGESIMCGDLRTGFMLASLHFHTRDPQDPNEDLGLSDLDIGFMQSHLAPFETRPILGVGVVDGDGRGYMALLQYAVSYNGLTHRRAPIGFQLLEHYRDVASRGWQGAESVRQLVMPGLVKSEALEFTCKDEMARISNPEAVRQFAYRCDAARSGWVKRVAPYVE